MDLESLLESTGALLNGHFRLSSGLHSNAYVQCARLLEDPGNASEVGAALATRAASLGATRVVAPALGGVVIGFTVAQALGAPMVFTERKDGEMTLRRGFALRGGENVLIVEDVVTTGKSTRETQRVVEGLGGQVVGFASIMNRSGVENPFDLPYVFLMPMALETWDESSCPLCRDGIPLDAPGSRFSK
jgi:orotate phosphoribosyltransferase